MFELLDKRLTGLDRSGSRLLLGGGRKGIEKESLRISSDGAIAQTPHFPELGSALTNRFITTDYSEAQLEFITPPFAGAWETVQFLCDIHQFVYLNISDELLWVTSMPCTVTGEENIPVARYGDSNVGRMKHVYRLGLGHRYGRVMQTISGVHFNYSVPAGLWPVLQDLAGNRGASVDFVSESYFGMLRNFRRNAWLILYLFGASPALCKSFLGDGSVDLDELDGGTAYRPYATTFRMSELGYKNKNQSALETSLNSMDEYIHDLTGAMHTSVPEYERIGRLVDGEYRQLGTGLLQIENEYYGLIRPKRVARSGESPMHALRRGGVEYVEVRALDVNVFDPVGLHRSQVCFMEAFLLFCLFDDSPHLETNDLEELDYNHSIVAQDGRRPGLMLRWHGQEHRLDGLARNIVEGMRGICDMLDEGEQAGPYVAALDEHLEFVNDADRTPSARILTELRNEKESFFAFGMRMANEHREYFEGLVAVNEQRLKEFEIEAAESLFRQKEIERTDSISFEQYLQNYYSQAT
ncbi:MAG: glutamate--cysteine ligase [Gammaproteobacteria bacterium]